MGRYYREFADFLADHFPGVKMQKLTVDAGFSCPNRDGTLSRGGCAYCNNASFSPTLADNAAESADIEAQIARARKFFARKYPRMRYLAYFQSYTNTYSDLNQLIGLYRRALECDGVDGLIIGTRPDCLPQDLVDELARLRKTENRWVMVELGAESANDATLERVNRCHSWADTVKAASMLRLAEIPFGLHLIMGLPGEDREMMLHSARQAAALHPDTIKFHQLQIVEGSLLGARWKQGHTFELFTPESYLPLCVELIDIFRRHSPATALERFTSQAPPNLLIAPRWNLKNYQFVNLLHNRLSH